MLEREQSPLIEAAGMGDEDAFGELLAPLNRELHVYSYRMLGGFHDAEDALQRPSSLTPTCAMKSSEG